MAENRKNYKKTWAAWLLTFLVSLSSVSCAVLAGPEYKADPQHPAEFRLADGAGLARLQLDDRELELYDRIDAALRNYEDQISEGLEDYSDDTIVKVYRYVLIDHPEYFWLRDGYLLKSATGLFRRKKVLEPLYAVEREHIEAYREQIVRIKDEILDTAETLPGEYETLLYIHDYLVSTVKYDTAAYTDIDTEQPSSRSLESTTAYGALINGTALCGGYAKAFQYLAEAAGIRCTTVTGHKKDGEPHIWNLVILDGEGYYVDVTWDDPVPLSETENSEERGEVFYNYFCITEEELLRTHVIDGEDNIALPDCTAETYNYFIYHDAYLETYSLDGAARILERAASAAQKMAYIKFSGEEDMDLAIHELFEEKEIFDILAAAGCETGTASYSRDAEHSILTVNFGYV